MNAYMYDLCISRSYIPNLNINHSLVLLINWRPKINHKYDIKKGWVIQNQYTIVL